MAERISDLLARGRTFSFEFFPPKTDAEQERLENALHDLEPLSPSFVSVTYRGGRSSRERTTNLVANLERDTSLNPMAHLICVAHTRAELIDILGDFKAHGLKNVLALGGDPATDADAIEGELKYGEEMVDLVREVGDFAIGVAAHPEIHPRSPSREADRDRLAAKLDKADFAITQFFFRLDDYASMMDDLKARGIDKPVLPGIMPISSLKSIKRMAELSGAEVPPEVVSRIVAVQDDDEAVKAEGIAIASELCQELLEYGVPGIHLITMNTSTATREIYKNLGLG
jgi:methylenetetrahydrofolate reductase (NADPH)